MAMKDILVHIDPSPKCAVRLGLAIGLARRYRAHLTGLFLTSQPASTSRVHGDDSPLMEAQANFEREAAHAGISAEWHSANWKVAGVGVAEMVNLHAYHQDLVIVGQTETDVPVAGIPDDLPEQVVLGSGRPVLVVPYAGEFEKVGERVIVAWRSGRESVRALNDAMPFLEGARHVSVVEVVRAIRGAVDGTGTGADVCVHLARHDIKAWVDKVTVADIQVGDVLLNQAWEGGCDLLVMGARTHSWTGAPTLGPITGHILKHMTIPVLMSH